MKFKLNKEQRDQSTKGSKLEAQEMMSENGMHEILEGVHLLIDPGVWLWKWVA